MRLQLLGNFNKEEAYEKAMKEPQKYIDLFMSDELTVYDPNVLSTDKDDKELVQKSSFLHVDEEAMEKYLFIKENSGFTLYRILPNVEESDIFHWKERWGNKKFATCRSLWCKVETDLLKFGITYCLNDGTARIAIWIRGGAMDHLSVFNATNEKLIEAINDYINKFKAKAKKMQEF